MLLDVLFRAIVLVVALLVLLLELVVLGILLADDLVLLLRLLGLGLGILLNRRSIGLCDLEGVLMIHLVVGIAVIVLEFDMVAVVDMVIAVLFDMVMLGVDIADFEVVHIAVLAAHTDPATPKMNPANIQTLSASAVPSLADTL